MSLNSCKTEERLGKDLSVKEKSLIRIPTVIAQFVVRIVNG